jgi:histone H3/H4
MPKTKRRSHDADLDSNSSSKQGGNLVIPAEAFGRLLQVVLNHFRDNQQCSVEAAQLIQKAVEREIMYLLRDAAERAFENKSSYPSAENIEGALTVYSRYKDEDTWPAYEAAGKLFNTTI